MSGCCARQRRQESAEARGRKILAGELKRRQWTERELKERRKSDPEKLAMATRMRQETILPMRTIAQLVCGIGHDQRGERESASVEKTGENSTWKKIKHHA